LSHHLDGNVSQITSLISEFKSISLEESPTRRSKIFDKQIERLSRKDTEPVPINNYGYSQSNSSSNFFGGSNMASEPLEISGNVPTSSGGFGAMGWLSNMQNQVASEYAVDSQFCPIQDKFSGSSFLCFDSPKAIGQPTISVCFDSIFSSDDRKSHVTFGFSNGFGDGLQF
jgi:hypothetical protein